MSNDNPIKVIIIRFKKWCELHDEKKQDSNMNNQLKQFRRIYNR